MLRVNVFLKMSRLCKPLPAFLALERPLSRVDELVSFKIPQIHESLLADGADVAFLSSVPLHVHIQSDPVFELLPALSARERLLAGVHAHVRGAVRFGQKPLPANLTRERPFSGVNELVFGESEVVDETLSALLALIAFLFGVDLHVPVETPNAGESFSTLRAGVWPLARVKSNVVL